MNFKAFFLLLLLSNFTAVSLPAKSQNAGREGLALYQQGKIKEARVKLHQYLEDTLRMKTPSYTWWGYYTLAWFEHEVSEHENALKHSLLAWMAAKKANNPWMLGRILSWIGWSYASMGHYPLAIEFFKKAIEVGAPNGKIKLVGVWGLSTQELGRIYMKQGKLKKARKILTAVYDYAFKRNVGPGISEGGAHLANLNLLEGNLGEAEKYAKASLRAAHFGNRAKRGSPNNLARSLVTYARVLYQKSLVLPSVSGLAEEEILKALEHCKKMHNKRYLAEAKILYSKVLVNSNPAVRMQLVEEALEILKGIKSEVLPMGNLELGKIYLEEKEVDLAKLYLKEGLKISVKQMQVVAQAYIIDEVAVLHGINDNMKAQVRELKKNIIRAKKSRLIPLLYQSYFKLMKLFESDGYSSLALNWNLKAQTALGTMIKNEKNDELKISLKNKLFELKMLEGEFRLSFDNENVFIL
jgi:tetratricopeptide (TPR) repeat protein